MSEKPKTRSKTKEEESDFYDLIYSETKQYYTLYLNERPIPGIFKFHNGEIHYFTKQPTSEEEEQHPCIELIVRASMDKSYKNDVLYLYSYYDDKISRNDCIEYSKHTIGESYHDVMGQLFDVLTKLGGFDRIELNDNARIISPRPGVNWNLRIINAIRNYSKNRGQSWYEKKFKFRPYNKQLSIFLKNPRWEHLYGIEKIHSILDKISNEEILSLLQKYDVKKSIQGFVDFLHELYENGFNDELYITLSNTFIQLVDEEMKKIDEKCNENDIDTDSYFKNVSFNLIHYEIEDDQINLVFVKESGGRKTKRKLHKKTRKSVRFKV
jgi:hypothetical protein